MSYLDQTRPSAIQAASTRYCKPTNSWAYVSQGPNCSYLSTIMLNACSESPTQFVQQGHAIYKCRNLPQKFFGSLKDNKDTATRYCKTDTSFSSFISLAATKLWLK